MPDDMIISDMSTRTSELVLPIGEKEDTGNEDISRLSERMTAISAGFLVEASP